MKKILFVFPFFCFLFLQVAFAQRDFRPGYIITNDNDTLYGQIDNRGNQSLSTSCVFLSADGIKTEYTPYDIRAFRFIDGKYFIAKEIDEMMFFLEFLIHGKISIYYRYKDGEDRYYMEKENEPLFEIKKTKELADIKGRTYEKKSKYHGTLLYYTKEAPELHKKIDGITEPTHKNMISLAQDYHNIVCDDEKCVIYEKKPARVKAAVEPVIGTSIGELLKTPYPGGGVYVHIAKAQRNEHLYLRTGLFVGETIRIPLQIEYKYPKGFFQPKLALGLIVPRTSIAGMAGFNIKITKELFLSANYDVDVHVELDTNGGKPSLNFLHHFSAGLYLSF